MDKITVSFSDNIFITSRRTRSFKITCMDKELFVKYLNNDCSPEELNEVLDWFRDHSVNFVEKEKVKHVWDEFEVTGKGLEPDESELLLDKIHHRRSLEESIRKKKDQIVYLRKKPYHNIFNALTRVAAVLFILVLFTLLYLFYR